jgi:hypothetical protein
MFCELDDSNLASLLEAKDELDYSAQNQIKSYDILRDIIIEDMTEKFGSLENVYPSIVKYLFTEENANKQKHKQMFWRVFGSIAVRNLAANLKSCHVCSACGIRIPDWYPFHECPTQIYGFVTCADCGKVVPRKNSRQCRCAACQKDHRRQNKTISMRKLRGKEAS